ncbi:DgaE family pyridoxal phosphate-dependent ammonia lyase [Streptomyces sp. NBC_01012]|uniref:DgaE family pyridoxal phosphate-dependent ammonia lyase n=1 Tax=Streptomyces sp. NBC_01012 TaxID=2903717 RepID=UPI00386C5A0F|nr:DgaE family pyridoxal phosphate-dependent ammonia lyase [Streptomyces sp. NBC_01012]
MGVYEELGLRPAINASGKMTALGGSVLDDAVVAAMGEAARSHVVMEDLLRVAGKVIAEATGAEDGCPTTGAASGIAIAVAAVIAGSDPVRVGMLPDAGGRPSEVLLLKGHSVNFGASVRQMIALGGGRATEVGSVNKVSAAHLEGSITERTAALLFVQSHHTVHKGQIPLGEMIAIGKRHGIPVIVDAAAEDDLRHWPATGADLVVYSGGKAIGGPTSGIVCGAHALIESCRAQYEGIARPMKVGKETVLGLLQALRQYGSEQDGDGGLDRMTRLAHRLGSLPGITGTVEQDEAGRHIHRAVLTVDPSGAGLDAQGLARELAAGEPPVFLRDHQAGTGRLAVDPRPLTEEEEEQLVHRFTSILGRA